ncbi:MAG: hypothetical protein ABI628_11725 [Chloroflexota bacterium]
MRAARLAGLVLVLGLSPAACAGPMGLPTQGPAGASPGMTPGSTSEVPSAPPSEPSPTPAESGSPSPDPAVRLAAARAYLAAARAYNTAKRALSPNATRTFEETRTYYRDLAKAEHAFLVAIRTVDFPADARSRVDLLLKLTAESEAWQLKGSATGTRSALDKIQPSIVRADQAASLAADLLRRDLGLPPIYL